MLQRLIARNRRVAERHAEAFVVHDELERPAGREGIGDVGQPLGDELRMRRDLSSDGERVDFELRLSWSASGADPG